MILDPSSLVKTLDLINAEFLAGKPIDPSEGLAAARWIASRQGQTGTYRGMPAPTPLDFEQGISVFTGEKLTHASARHIMGEEAVRAMWLLGRQEPEVIETYRRATDWMRTLPSSCPSGMFCCGRCADALWRHMWIAEFAEKEAFILKGLETLKTYRLGNGTWARFPFYYTIFTLLEIDLEPARLELKYARPVMEKYLRSSKTGEIASRRKSILAKALNVVM